MMSDDLISRQDAIDALEREKSLVERPITETRWFDLGLRKAQEILSELLSTQPERKKGKWTLNKDGNWACPFCKFDPYHDNMKGMNYCPNCGAEMRGADDGEIH